MRNERDLAVAAWVLSTLVAASGCGDAGLPASTGIAIAIAPVVYAGAVDVCYGLHVADAQGRTVALRERICTRGAARDAGGRLAVTAPCDASAGGAATVTLWLDHIELGAGAADEGAYTNPCGLERGAFDVDGDGAPEFPPSDINDDGFTCTKQVACVPEAPARVAFDLAVVHDAQRDLYGVGVDFADISCTASVDTCYRRGESPEIALLFDQDAGESGRDRSAVLTLACAGGRAAAAPDVALALHYARLRLLCDAGTIAIPLDPTGPDGDKAATTYVDLAAGGDGVAAPLDAPVAYATYWGTAQLPCGLTTCARTYWNVAVDLEDLAELGFTDCALETVATATGADGVQLVNGGLAGDGVSYAAITYHETVLDAGRPTCDWNPVDGANRAGEPSGVRTAYFGSGDLLEHGALPTMCYTLGAIGDTAPAYMPFADRHTGPDSAAAAGFVGARWTARLGGNLAAGCDEVPAVVATRDAAAWDVQAGVRALRLSLVAAHSEGAERVAAQLYGDDGAAWRPLAAPATLAGYAGRGVVLDAVGLRRVALVLTRTPAAGDAARTYTLTTHAQGRD